jgi:DNA-binding MarR family transcriptional regulator
MVLGLLATSITSGQLISKTGRYKVFPIIGTALMTVALFLLSRLTESTPTGVMWLYFFILGLGLGLILQVLVIAVQNSADYADLGAATSGVTFFRSIGGSFGVSIFGSIFSNRLASEIRTGLRGVPLPAHFNPSAAQGNPHLIRLLPAAVRAGILHAYTLSIQTVFRYAVPVAIAAFVLTWFLREVPLRNAVGAAANPADVGDGLGAASAQRSSVDELERALVHLAGTDLRHRGYQRMAEMAGLDMPAGSAWVLARLAKQDHASGPDLARQAGVTVEYGKPYVDLLVERGMVTRDDGWLGLTPAGHAAADRLFAARHDLLSRLVADWSPEQHAELAQLLRRLSRDLLGAVADRPKPTEPADQPADSRRGD